MRIRRLAFVFLLLGVSALLSCSGANPSQPAAGSSNGEVLYILNNGTVTTYSVDPNSLVATPMEQPVTLIPNSATLVQFAPAPDDHFVYAVWSDGQNVQHLSAFQTDSSGVPQTPAIQVLNADTLSQFDMHPSGRFAYMLEVTSPNGQYRADIRLFRVQGNAGTLKENPQVQGSYGPAPYWPAFLYGFSTDGSKLYDTSTITTGAVYRQRPIDLKNGALGNDTQIFSVSGEQQVAIGTVIVDQHQSDGTLAQSYLDIFPNTPNPTRPIIHCTMAMLSFCSSATNVQLDPSNHFLVLTDPATQKVHFAAISLHGKTIHNTGSFMPMTSQTPGYAFSPDGNIVYAVLASDNSLHFYHFNSNSGAVSEGGTPLPLTSSSGFCPALYH